MYRYLKAFFFLIIRSCNISGYRTGKNEKILAIYSHNPNMKHMHSKTETEVRARKKKKFQNIIIKIIGIRKDDEEKQRSEKKEKKNRKRD